MVEMMAAGSYRATVWPVLHVQDQAQFTYDNGLPWMLLHMCNTGELCDVTLHLNGRDFPAHRVVLAASSQYFRMMFTTNMKEKNSSIIDLTESIILDDVQNFQMVMYYMYTGQVQMDLENVEDFIRVADFLLLQELKDFCQEFYLRYLNLNLSNCLRVGALADQHNLNEVRAVARNILCSRFHDHIAFGDELLELPESHLLTIVRDSVLTKFMSPDDIVRCILRWIQREASRKSALLRMLQYIPITILRLDTIESLLTVPEISNDLTLLHKLQHLHKKVRRQSQRSTPPTLRPRKCLSYAPRSKPPGASMDGVMASSSSSPDQSEDVLLCINTNPFLKFIKILLYRVSQHKWFTISTNVSQLLNNIPGTQTIGAATLHGQKLYLFVSYFIPFPQNMQNPIVLEYDLETGDHRQLLFIIEGGMVVPGCETSIIDLKSVPPVFLYHDGRLYIVANVNSMGCLYICDIETQTFELVQIPAMSFISKARAVIHDEQMWLWCRHRMGNEDIHFHPQVSIVVYELRYNIFLAGVPIPPGINYVDFENAHILCATTDAVVVHTPGSASYKLCDGDAHWQPEPCGLPGFPRHRESPEVGYHGHKLYLACGARIYLIQNPAVYTTSLCSLSPGEQTVTCLRPPPLDGVNVVTSGSVPITVFTNLQEAQQFDLSYTTAIMNPEGHPNCDSDSDNNSEQITADPDEQDRFVLDDEIYGFN